MSYSTKNDILALEMTAQEMEQITDDDKTGAIVSSIVDAAILKADTSIDGYCRDRYTVPFNPVPDEIKFLSAEMAAYWLWRRRQQVSDSVLDKYTKALAKLKRISEGKYSLKDVTEITDSSGIASTTEDVAHTFTRTKNDAAGNIIGKAGSMEKW
jgi:phage gp36-like protein